MVYFKVKYYFSEDSTTQKQSQPSTISDESNVENAISFDEPAQVETLSITASKVNYIESLKNNSADHLFIYFYYFYHFSDPS